MSCSSVLPRLPSFAAAMTLALAASWLPAGSASAQTAGLAQPNASSNAATPIPPKIGDDSLEVTLFASEPMVKQPIGCTIDSRGRFLVIESNSHFRPKDWKGPAHDEILILTDTDGDGKADKREVFFDQTDMTMDIATHPDGWIYLSTRNEILRLRDDDGDGKPEKIERKLVWLETEGRYPHNGLSGLAFDAKGDLYFGMGENLGAPYTITGSDGESYKDEAEGGHVWHVGKDGKRLKRIADGFWNPFGVCVDPWGNVFATDNDPDSSPPCRLHHIIPGGDYGYQFRYGRTGLHPFVSWNGSRLGTLPMLAGTGEAPCDVLFYEGRPNQNYRGLGANWAGTLMVASWVDHRVESYKLTPGKGTFTQQRQILLQGGADFRPVAFATAADGTFFVTDWVKRDYQLHGFGRVWSVRARQPQDLKEPLAKPYAATPGAALRERIEKGPAPQLDEATSWLGMADSPYIYSAAIERLSKEPPLVQGLLAQTLPDPRLRAAGLLAARRGLHREGLSIETGLTPEIALGIQRGLEDSDPQVLLIALHWISDDRIQDFKPLVVKLLNQSDLTPDLFYAAVTTLVRLNSEKVNETDLVARLKDIINDPSADASRIRMAIQVLPGHDRFLKPEELDPLIRKSAPELASWLTEVLGLLQNPNKQDLLLSLARDTTLPPSVRAAAVRYLNLTVQDAAILDQALAGDSEIFERSALVAFGGVTLPAATQAAVAADKKPELQAIIARMQGGTYFPANRPALTDIAGWRSYLETVPGKADLQHGREVFLSPRLGGCAMCHTKDGLGSPAGPNLSHIQDAASPDYVLTSLLQPNANVAPQFECFAITTTDGQTRTAFQLNERGDFHTYIDLSGTTFTVKIEDIVRRDHLPVSIMPEGIVTRLTDAEVRDLMAYLEAKAEEK